MYEKVIDNNFYSFWNITGMKQAEMILPSIYLSTYISVFVWKRAAQNEYCYRLLDLLNTI